MPPGIVFRLVALTVVLVAPRALAESNQVSVSTSRQFIVYGMDLRFRGAICDLAERTKRELLTVLREPDQWLTSIVVNARRPEANLPELPRLQVDLGQTGSGLRLQLDVTISSALRPAELRRELLRALLLEMMYRAEPQLLAGSAYARPPAWLLDGIPSDDSDVTRETVRALLASPARSGNVWPLHKFLNERPELFDGTTVKLYRAYSVALVDLLRSTPNGSHLLKKFILDLAQPSNDPLIDLRNHFPGLFGNESLETIWRAHIEQLSRAQPTQLMSVGQTELRLDEALRVHPAGHGIKRTYALAEFRTFLREKSAGQALVVITDSLLALASRAHPFYSPFIAEYTQIVSLIRRGRTLDVPRRLEKLAQARRGVIKQMRQIDDYLNWFEATSARDSSGQFDDYMKAAERAHRPERVRRDAISVYLDAMEIEFEN